MRQAATVIALTVLALSGAGWVHHKLVARSAFVNQYSLALDGAGDFIDIGTPADINGVPNAQPITMSAWIRINSAAGTGKQMFIAKNDGTNIQWALYRDTSVTLSFYAGGVYAGSASPTINNDTWTHVVGVVRNESPYKLRGFTNGTQSTTTQNAGTTTNTTNWTLGKNSTAPLPLALNGYIDEVTFWDIGLSDAEIAELRSAGKPGNPKTHSQAAHLIHWYRFDGDTGGVARDWAGSANGTYNGDAVLSTVVP